MRISIIGAGKVGCSLGKLLAVGGIPLAGYYSRTPQSAREAAAFTNSRYYSSLEALVSESDAIFITVPDRAITAVYRQLRPYNIQDKFLCHCSGAMSAAEAFPGIGELGAYGISIHPLFPISSRFASYRELTGAFFCLEGDPAALACFVPLLQGLGLRVQQLSAQDKSRYHAACVMASNLMCALAQCSIDLLADCGFAPELARQALAPLMAANLTQLLRVGPAEALTGPVERGDLETVQKHLHCLTDPQDQALYRLLSLRLLPLARQRRPQADYTALETLLNGRTTTP